MCNVFGIKIQMKWFGGHLQLKIAQVSINITNIYSKQLFLNCCTNPNYANANMEHNLKVSQTTTN